MEHLTKIEKTAYLILGLIALLGIYLGISNEVYFDTRFAQEDGPVEWGTTVMLFGVFALSLYRLVTLGAKKKILWRIGTFIFALLFFFAAGEEISWGQRIFSVESSEFFLKNNAQGETNLHNLMIGETKINKIIFSQLLFLVMFLYLLVAPVLYRKQEWFKKLADNFAVPIVEWHHTIAFLVTTVMVALNPADRKWEVYELAFGVIFLLVFIKPLNRSIFEKE